MISHKSQANYTHTTLINKSMYEHLPLWKVGKWQWNVKGKIKH